MDDLRALEVVLDASVKRKGEVPLTNAHLLNIVRMARRVKNHQEELEAKREQDLYNEVMEDQYRYGSGD